MLRKITAALMAIALLISSVGFAAGKPQRMKVTVTAILVENYQVGNEWTVDCEINGQTLFDGQEKDTKVYNKNGYIKKPEKEKVIGEDTVRLGAGDELVIITTVGEYDKDYPEDGSDVTTRTVSAAELRDGFTVEVDVTVIENAGQYAGNKATWRIAYQFKP